MRCGRFVDLFFLEGGKVYLNIEFIVDGWIQGMDWFMGWFAAGKKRRGEERCQDRLLIADSWRKGREGMGKKGDGDDEV